MSTASVVRDDVSARLAASAVATASLHSDDDIRTWFAGAAKRNAVEVTPLPLDELPGWETCPETGDLRHVSGRFFSVRGIVVTRPGHWAPRWSQPIIVQPEVGILGFVAAEIDGVLHLLVQAKVEPGNAFGLQLAPTVQATRSNFTRVHQGNAVPYLEYFADPTAHRVVVDVLQSEQGSWFLRKQNRNVVVEVAGDVEAHEDFCWMTLRQLYAFLRERDVVNMDARTVLGCLPLTGPGVADAVAGSVAARSAVAAVLAASCDPEAGSVEDLTEVLSHLTVERSMADHTVVPVPLRDVERWHRDTHAVAHDSGRFFRMIGVGVRASGREVRSWSQPILAPAGEGLCGFLVARHAGVLHALAQLRVEPGFVDGVEFGPTVQCTPANYVGDHAAHRPPFLDALLPDDPARVHYDTLLSEEGGRFYHALTRYVVTEVDAGDLGPLPPGYVWLAPHQLSALARHPRYLDVQARSTLTCLHSLLAPR
ncbi:MAG: dTDP-4-dehydro-6-deoxy-alpha-D-glucopyranose 2,3-dehydratase [Actinomycetota bacterium]|nr:dTDP-4-dehydro-6-deoxy-alpha-D-glucopyranose 2,3-dehydratase [Actinomycetota bacterium]